MGNITILNASKSPIYLELYYLQNNSTEYNLKITDFFGPTKYKTMRFPDNCTKIIIEVITETSPGVESYMASMEIPISTEKIFKFINYNDIDCKLIEINSDYIKNMPIIKLQNKTLNKIKIEINFTFENELIKINNIINKNRSLLLPLTNNISNISISLWHNNNSPNWIPISTITLLSIASKCYEVTKNYPNSLIPLDKIKLNEINCTK